MLLVAAGTLKNMIAKFQHMLTDHFGPELITGVCVYFNKIKSAFYLGFDLI